MAAMITIIKYDQLATDIYKMDHFCQIDNVMHYLNLIDGIAHQIEILIATYAIICKAS